MTTTATVLFKGDMSKDVSVSVVHDGYLKDILPVLISLPLTLLAQHENAIFGEFLREEELNGNWRIVRLMKSFAPRADDGGNHTAKARTGMIDCLDRIHKGQLLGTGADSLASLFIAENPNRFMTGNSDRDSPLITVNIKETQVYPDVEISFLFNNDEDDKTALASDIEKINNTFLPFSPFSVYQKKEETVVSYSFDLVLVLVLMRLSIPRLDRLTGKISENDIASIFATDENGKMGSMFEKESYGKKYTKLKSLTNEEDHTFMSALFNVALGMLSWPDENLVEIAEDAIRTMASPEIDKMLSEQEKFSSDPRLGKARAIIQQQLFSKKHKEDKRKTNAAL